MPVNTGIQIQSPPKFNDPLLLPLVQGGDEAWAPHSAKGGQACVA